jgi:hypothetical protein
LYVCLPFLSVSNSFFHLYINLLFLSVSNSFFRS